MIRFGSHSINGSRPNKLGSYMLTPSKNELPIKSGSNLDSFSGLVEQLQLAIRKQRKPIADAFRKLSRSKQSLLNKAALKKIASVIQDERKSYDLEVLGCRGNTNRIAKLKKAARKEISKILFKTIPNAKKITALNEKHAKQYKKISSRLANVFDERIRTHLGVVLPELLGYETFEAPFELYGVYSDLVSVDQPGLGPETDQYITYNNSFVIPSWGVMANDFTFRHNHSSWLKRFDYRQRENLAVLGIKYKMPKTGFVNVSAVLRNMSNSIVMSITDNFGFSMADIDARHSLYVIIVRPPGSAALFDFHYQVTIDAGLLSDGDDVSDSIAPLQTTVPYTLNFSTPEMFNEGDELSILIGTQVFVDSYLEFMKSTIDATLAWNLKAMYVSVTEP
jgi:hypothetical protein